MSPRGSKVETRRVSAPSGHDAGFEQRGSPSCGVRGDRTAPGASGLGDITGRFIDEGAERAPLPDFPHHDHRSLDYVSRGKNRYSANTYYHDPDNGYESVPISPVQ